MLGRKVMIGLIAAAFAAGISGGIFTYRYLAEAQTSQPVQVQPQESTGSDDSLDVNQFITDTHEYFNELVCYGRIDTFKPSWKTSDRIESVKEYDEAWWSFTGTGGGFKGDYPELMLKLDKLLPSIKDEALKEDLENAKDLLTYAKKGRSADALVQLHRLFHDLDSFYIHDEKANVRLDHFHITHKVDGSNMLDVYLEANFVSKDLFGDQKPPSENAFMEVEPGKQIPIDEYYKQHPEAKYRHN